jgi:hypothetical protein
MLMKSFIREESKRRTNAKEIIHTWRVDLAMYVEYITVWPFVVWANRGVICSIVRGCVLSSNR